MGVCIVREQASNLCLLGAHQGIICSFPICLFCRALIFQICLNYFFPKLSTYPRLRSTTPTHHLLLPYMPFLPSADISNLFELFFFQNYRHTPRTVCHASTTGMSPTPPHMCLFCLALIFQICLNYFFPKLSTYLRLRSTTPRHHLLLPYYAFFAER
jgi:hypothetical protein